MDDPGLEFGKGNKYNILARGMGILALGLRYKESYSIKLQSKELRKFVLFPSPVFPPPPPPPTL